jgi:phosphate/sulfate permease
MFSLLGGIFLGWSLGANHAANCFGSAVASRMVRFWTAAIICACFVLIGALLEGQPGIRTLSGLTSIDLEQAVAITVAVALTVTVMTLLSLPVSTSQGVMETVGRKLVRLDPFSALIVVLAEAITVHFNALVGVPVSTTQAVIGAVVGVGLVKGAKTINRTTLYSIFTGWLLTPTVAFFIASSTEFALHLRYVPRYFQP